MENKPISHERLMRLGFSWYNKYLSDDFEYYKDDIKIESTIIDDERVYYYSDTLEPIKII